MLICFVGLVLKIIFVFSGMYPALLDRLQYSAAAKELELKRLGADLADRATAIDRGSGDSSQSKRRRKGQEEEEESEDDPEP